MRRFLPLALLLAATPATAQVEHDLQSWTRVGVAVPVAEDWTATVDVQPRFADDLGRLAQVNARLFVDRRLSERWSVALGYHHAEDPVDGGADRVENRAIEGVTWTPEWGALEPQLRFRLEQRWRSDGDERQDRARLFARVALPVRDSSKVKLVAWEETFVVTAVDWRPRGGFEQQRFYAGVQAPLGAVTLETGYMAQIADEAGPGATVSHVLLTSLVWRPGGED